MSPVTSLIVGNCLSDKMNALPAELFNHIISFCQPHPVARLIQVMKANLNLCVNCMEKPRFKDHECCSSICNRQMNDDPWFEFRDPIIEGKQFERFMK
jgi:hypothetical protein